MRLPVREYYPPQSVLAYTDNIGTPAFRQATPFTLRVKDALLHPLLSQTGGRQERQLSPLGQKRWMLYIVGAHAGGRRYLRMGAGWALHLVRLPRPRPEPRRCGTPGLKKKWNVPAQPQWPNQSWIKVASEDIGIHLYVMRWSRWEASLEMAKAA